MSGSMQFMALYQLAATASVDVTFFLDGSNYSNDQVMACLNSLVTLHAHLNALTLSHNAPSLMWMHACSLGVMTCSKGVIVCIVCCMLSQIRATFLMLLDSYATLSVKVADLMRYIVVAVSE